jgi:membrane fusion protein (multidrug efflux system)
MKTSSKIKTLLIIFFVAIFAIITARHFIGLHFKKKFSVRPAPGVIVAVVEKSLFYKNIETFGTAIAQSSKAYRVQASDIDGKLNLENRFVKKGEKILTLKDGESLIADIKVPENYVGVLKTGLKAEVTSSAYKKVFKGKIETISSRIDPSTRSILSRIIVDNSNFEIIPGQLMTVKIIYDEKKQIGVPESAVTIQGNTAFVYTVNDDTAEKKNIEIGKRNFGKVSIISGLNEGDTVISEGVSKVRDKGKIKIITSSK